MLNGDTVYADGPIAEQKLPNGHVWKNIVTEEKSKCAETLAEFRGNYKYNLLDKNLRAFNEEVPILAQWDDHEVTNNWWPGEPLTRAEHQRSIPAIVSRTFADIADFVPAPLRAGYIIAMSVT